MAIAFVGAAVTAGVANPTGAQTWPLHASAAAGQYAIGMAYSRGSTKTFASTENAATLGVDLVVENGINASYGHLLIVGKTLVAADITNGYFGTMNLSSVANATTGWGSLVFSGVDTAAPIDAEGTIAGVTGSTAPNCPAVTVGTTGSCVVAVWGSGQETTNNVDGDFSVPSGYTLTTLRWTTTLGSDAAMQAFYMLNATAGSNDPGTSTTIVSSYWYAHTISLEAASDNRTATGQVKLQLPLLGGTVTNTPPARSAGGSLKTQLPLLGGTAANAPPRTADGVFKAQLPLLGGAATNVPPARTGTGILKTQLPLLGGTGTNTPPPPRVATGTLKTKATKLGGTGTNVPPARSADGSLLLGNPKLAGSGTNVPPARSAGGTLTIGPLALSGAATNEPPPPRSAAGTLTLKRPRLGGSVTNTPPEPRSSDGTLRAQLVLLGGSATNTPAGGATASGGLALQALQLGGAAGNVPPERTSDGSLALPPLALGGSATNKMHGVSAAHRPHLSIHRFGGGDFSWQ